VVIDPISDASDLLRRDDARKRARLTRVVMMGGYLNSPSFIENNRRCQSTCDAINRDTGFRISLTLAPCNREMGPLP